jgi:hypothetical protein
VAALINDFAAKHFDLVEQYINAPEKMDFDDIINVELLINKQIREDSEFAKFLFFVSCQMEWSETIISKVHPAIEQTKNVGHNLLLKALQGLQKRGKIRPEVDVAIITEILRMMYSGMLEGFFSKRLEHDFDDVVKTGFNLVFNSIKTQGNSDEN